MTEKRKAIEISGTDSSDPNNVSYLQKPTKIIKTTISSAPVRYNSKEENLPAIFSSVCFFFKTKRNSFFFSKFLIFLFFFKLLKASKNKYNSFIKFYC